MDRLKQHPDLTIAQVANKYGIEYNRLMDEQLQMLRNSLRRDNKFWTTKNFGR